MSGTPGGVHRGQAVIGVPCGQCIGCRIEYSRQWAMRVSHEASLYENNCFVTLTYSDDNLPTCGSLVPRDLTLFLKRLRDAISPRRFRYYACGEYGDLLGRPHYHICLLGFDFEDKKFWRSSPSGHRLYRSALLESKWTLGSSEVGDVTFESAAYVARYTVKKVNGAKASEHYHRVDVEGRSHFIQPEFGRMSRMPGIGQPWLDKYHTDVYDFDYCIVRGVKCRPPKFYDHKFKYLYPSEFEQVSLRRSSDVWLHQRAIRDDNTPERLAVKAEIDSARLMSLSRSI